MSETVERLDLEKLARAIAADLFVDGQGKPAKRLVMEREGKRIDGTGWSEAAVRDRILSRLRAAPEVAEPDEAADAIERLRFAALGGRPYTDHKSAVERDTERVRAALRSPRIEKAEPDSEPLAQELEMYAEGRKIMAIRSYRRRVNCSLTEAKRVLENPSPRIEGDER